MPLILFCGYPASGKTKRATELKEGIIKEKPHVDIVLIDDSPANRDEVYSDRKLEIVNRSSLKSAVERSLTQSNVVIVDAMNYVKGFRYELHCVAKYARSTYCVIHCDVSTDDALKFNNEKQDGNYSRDVLEALIARFEVPNSINRWDSPLFTIQTTDQLPYDDIFNALFAKKSMPKPNMSTQNPPLMSPSFVHEVDTMLQTITGSIISGQKTSVVGDTILISGVNESYTIKRKLSLAEIRRKRKEFLTYLRANPVADVSQVSKTFLCFLNT